MAGLRLTATVELTEVLLPPGPPVMPPVALPVVELEELVVGGAAEEVMLLVDVELEVVVVLVVAVDEERV